MIRIISDAITYPTQHKPSGLLRNCNIFMQLGTAYAFLMSQEHVYRYKPFLQRNMRTLEHSSYRYGKPFPAILAFV